ncbi:MAG: hydrogenase formation protein HypD [candidate division WOR-3 bacterium]
MNVARALVSRVNRLVGELCRTRERVSLMEVCGTHTMAISGFGIRRAVDPRLRLLSGPGCPVCVTDQTEIDAAIELARVPGVSITTFGDMVRVPGSRGSLEQARAEGADVRVVYSALDAVGMAADEPEREYVFLGVGFETTAPTVAAAVKDAARRRVGNFSVWPMFKLIPPALRFICEVRRAKQGIDGFILPGHVSTIIGTRPYEFVAREFGVPCCVAGFEATDVLQAILMLLEQLSDGRAEVENQYRRSVKPEGNRRARQVMDSVFAKTDAVWRGLGRVGGSGLGFRPRWQRHDASRRFRIRAKKPKPSACRCGDVMLGVVVPPECRLFARGCTPERPAGPCMVSSEGACAAYYKYERQTDSR